MMGGKGTEGEGKRGEGKGEWRRRMEFRGDFGRGMGRRNMERAGDGKIMTGAEGKGGSGMEFSGGVCAIGFRGIDAPASDQDVL